MKLYLLTHFGKTFTNLLKLIIVLYICSFLLFPFLYSVFNDHWSLPAATSVKNFSRSFDLVSQAKPKFLLELTSIVSFRTGWHNVDRRPLVFSHSSPTFTFCFPFVCDSFWSLVGTSGLEPPTSRLSGARSNHLSYAPLWLSVAFSFCASRFRDWWR